MYLYTIGSSKKSSRQFFEPIKYHRIQIVIDVRLKNDSQLLGFTRCRDISYFLKAVNCDYEPCINYAPSDEILKAWRKKLITWPEYERRYRALMFERDAVKEFLVMHEGLHEAVCLLCSEPTPEHCHRRLFAEMIKEERPEFEIIHL